MFRTTRFLAVGFAALLGSTTAPAQERYVADEVIAVVGNSPILYSEIVEMGQMIAMQRREQGYTSDRNPRSEAFENLLNQKLLYSQAMIDSLSIPEESISAMVDSRLDELVASLGSTAALEKMYNKPMYAIKADQEQLFREAQYAQLMQQEVQSKTKISAREVEKFYREIPRDSLPIIPEQYVYAQIVRYPSSSQDAKMRTRERLLGLRERIIKGERFDVLARLYSIDANTARYGGENPPLSREEMTKPFADVVTRLQPGQVSEVIETEYGFHIAELLGRSGNKYRFRHILLRPVYTPEELASADEMLDSLATAIREGRTTFEAAAEQYSEDPYSKLNGGVVTNYEMLQHNQMADASLTSTRFFTEDLLADDARVLRTLKPGDVSAPFQSTDIRGNNLSRIIKLVEVIPAHPADLHDDYLIVERMALQYKQYKEFTAWLNKKIGEMYVRIEPDFKFDDFDNKEWLKK
ncbi:MAG: peptidylprolyl isomerase [Rikenellaceae bacterium]|nr:peptidylprolyl isomerase [Rikenellaceae bacterium]